MSFSSMKPKQMIDISEWETYHERRLPSKPRRTSTIVAWDRERGWKHGGRLKGKEGGIQRGKATQKPTGGGNPAKEEEVVTEASCWFRFSHSSITMRMPASSLRAISWMEKDPYCSFYTSHVGGGTLTSRRAVCIFPITMEETWAWWGLEELKGRGWS